MSRSRAEILTPNASKYLVQLSKHWSHKFPVEWDDAHSHIPFAQAQAQAWLEAKNGLLVAEVEAPEADLAHMQKVVADHLNRFAFREGELAFDWKRTEA